MADDVFADVEGTRERILAATYRALCTHGYADLTIKRIGEEFEKSPSLVYHHYENKDEVVLACLEFMFDRFEERITAAEVDDPRAELRGFLDWIVSPADTTDDGAFLTTMIELRVRASYDDAYLDHFVRSDRLVESYLETVLEAGVEAGTFRECDSVRTAGMLATTLNGVILRRATTDDAAWIEDVRAELEAYLEARVYADSDAS